MFQLNSLIKRNIKIFIKDKASVFFSFLSVMILLLLYFLFINNLYKDSLLNLGIDKKLETFIVTAQMMGGVLVLNTVTLSLGMLGTMVNDNYNKKTESFLVTPVSRTKITLSYVISTVLVTYVLTLVMFVITLIYILIMTGYMYSIGTILIIIGLLFVFTIISTSFMVLMVTFINSVSAFGAVSGIFGTIIGFTSGIYMPLSNFPEFLVKIASLIPFTQMTILMKKIMLEKPLKLLVEKTQIPTEGLDQIKEAFGVKELGLFGNNVNMWIIFIFITILTTFFFILSMKRISKKRVK